MARERAKYASVRPSQAEEGGGKFTIPAGAEVEVTEALWVPWSEAGESALKGGRSGDDPALKLTCEVKGMDEPMTEFLGAGKATRLVPSRDGEHLEPADGSSAGAITKDCNADVFLASICDTKLHKKMAFDEKLLDDGISSIVGLRFISGRKIVERNIDDSGEGRNSKKARPTLVATEILELPKGGGSSRGKDKDEDERPARGRGRDDDDKGGDGDIEEAAEKALLEVLEMSKYSKGIHRDKAFAAVYNVVKEEKDGKKIAAQVEDAKWLEGSKRPWTVDRDGLIEKA